MGGESRIERCGEGGRATGESLSQWEMTNAICPEHSACVNPRRVPADPHPTLRPLYPLAPKALLSASTPLVEDSTKATEYSAFVANSGFAASCIAPSE